AQGRELRGLRALVARDRLDAVPRGDAPHGLAVHINIDRNPRGRRSCHRPLHLALALAQHHLSANRPRQDQARDRRCAQARREPHRGRNPPRSGGVPKSHHRGPLTKAYVPPDWMAILRNRASSAPSPKAMQWIGIFLPPRLRTAILSTTSGSNWPSVMK